VKGRTFQLIVVLCVGVLAWGYWHSVTHATTHFFVRGSPHDIKIDLYDAAGAFLASARSVEPEGYIVVVHPDPAIGDCRQFEGNRKRYAECFKQSADWVAEWIDDVRSAKITTPKCAVPNVPVLLTRSNEGWWYWWVPHPHFGGIPYRHVEVQIDFDSRAC
jgi:hypothetical protein